MSDRRWTEVSAIHPAVPGGLAFAATFFGNLAVVLAPNVKPGLRQTVGSVTLLIAFPLVAGAGVFAITLLYNALAKRFPWLRLRVRVVERTGDDEAVEPDWDDPPGEASS